MSFTPADTLWMQRALLQAQTAAQHDEVPIGALLVRDDELLSEAYNQPIALHDPTAHAEILALRAAGQVEKNYRLPGTTLYTTLEPCAMCAGALIHARVARVVFAAFDPKGGAAGSRIALLNVNVLNHQVQCEGGLLSDVSTELLQAFFRVRRGAAH